MAFSPQRLAACAGVGAAGLAGMVSSMGTMPKCAGGARWGHGEQIAAMFAGSYWILSWSSDWETARVKLLEPGAWKTIREITNWPRRMSVRPLIAMPLAFGSGIGMGVYARAATALAVADVVTGERDQRAK